MRRRTFSERNHELDVPRSQLSARLSREDTQNGDWQIARLFWTSTIDDEIVFTDTGS
jgi:hypothetical protein